MLIRTAPLCDALLHLLDDVLLLGRARILRRRERFGDSDAGVLSVLLLRRLRHLWLEAGGWSLESETGERPPI